ncbi:hypothetical protein XENOCAPTIV_016292 [Xenoophorus captivus]|uniref:Uncharacterized protein n=1 Tax=Xenoophorus captivus TaxID=1517983 RepID=A0ABV0SAK6_9TELE
MSLMQLWTKLYAQLGRPLPKDLSCIDDLSNSLFSSPADSLSEYADNQPYISANHLETVPTLWDINTSTTTATQAQSHLEVSSNGHQKATITFTAKYA